MLLVPNLGCAIGRSDAERRRFPAFDRAPIIEAIPLLITMPGAISMLDGARCATSQDVLTLETPEPDNGF